MTAQAKPASFWRHGLRTGAAGLLLIIATFLPSAPVVMAAPASSAGKKSSAPAAKDEPAAEKKLSPADAEKLFRSVDEILQFVSKDTGLPIKHPVKRELASRDTVERYMLQHMREDEDAIRMQRAEVVMKKLGLLPQDFALEPFLLKLMREQVAGFYDAKTKTVYLLDWIRSEEQRPVLAHELTHALQDQNFDLEKWSHATPEGKERERSSVNELIASDERNTARGAVLEGQGMVTLLDYMLAPTGRTIAEAPELLAVMKQGMIDSEKMPFFSNAPVVIKELLGFPYRQGLEFEVALLKSEGKPGAFKGALTHPPETTHEVMEPGAYMAHQKFPQIVLADLPLKLGTGYERYDVGAMGEFDVYVLVKTFAGEEEAVKISKEWRGGLYYAARKATTALAAASAVATTGDVALLHEYHFASRDTAQMFADVYGRSLPRKYNSVRRVGEEELRRTENGLAPATVKPVNAAGGFGGSVAAVHSDKPGDAAPSHVKWITNEGPVYVDVSSTAGGGAVLIMEGFDQKSAGDIRGSMASSRTPQALPELGLRLMPFAAAYGWRGAMPKR